MRLPDDVSKCSEEMCNIRDKCERFLQRNNEGDRMVFIQFEGGENCSGLIEKEEAIA